MDTVSVPSTATTPSDTAAITSLNATMNGNTSSSNNHNNNNNNSGGISRLSEAAAARKELRQSRIGSSSSMDSTSSTMQFRKSYPSSDINASFSSSSVAGSIMDDLNSDQSHLTQAELEDYSRTYFGQHVFHHQKQSSYAQSEGYHSYVSSSDSSSATPFLDRLRQETELLSRASSHWSDLQSNSACSSSASNLNSTQPPTDNNSSESTSSSETLKWLGSMSDVSVSSHATNSSAVSGSVSTSQLIAHSSRVMTPKRHNSESVLYMTEDQLNAAQAAADQSHYHSDHSQPLRDRFNRRSNMRLYPSATQYSEEHANATNALMLAAQTSPNKSQQNASWQSVADRINELERQNSVIPPPLQGHYHKAPSAAMHQKYTFLDPSKTTRVSNPALKAIQKKAVQSYFERQQSTNPIRDLAATRTSFTARPQSLPVTSSSVPSAKPVNQSRSSLPSNYAAQHFSSPRHSPPSPVASTNNALSNGVMPPPSISCASIHSSPVLTKSENISTSVPLTSPSSASPQTSTTHVLTSPSYQATFHQAAATYNPSGHSSTATIRTNGDANQMMAQSYSTFNDDSMNESGVPPPPPRRGRPVMPVRRTSSAAEYSAYRDHNLQKQSLLSKDLLEAMVIGPIISLDDWVPERPPKNPSLRIPSPDLPPPPPSTHVVVDALANDEPLPPPPPELLRHVRQLSEPDTKPLPPSRRNSFAGSTNKRNPYRSPVTTENSSPLATPLPASPQSSPPPAIPKKSLGPQPQPNQERPPATIPLSSMQYSSYAQKAQPQRPISSMSKYPHHPAATHHASSKPFQQSREDDSTLVSDSERTSESTRVMMRKRTHNAQLTPIEMPAVNAKLMPAHSGPHSHQPQQPPPLKPRLPVHSTDPNSGRSISSMGARLRSNSKASYLPRQSREKLNVDPDHGVYKLTLTSNEDFVNHNNNNNHQSLYHHQKATDILGPKFNNLPDVLPVGAKIHSPPSQPPSRYGSNNNIHSGPLLSHHQGSTHPHYHHTKIPHTAPPHPQHNHSSGYSMKSMFNFSRSSSTNAPSPAPASSPPLSKYNHRDGVAINNHPDTILSKIVSQSNIDLMKTHILNVNPNNESHLKSTVQNGQSPTLSSRHQSPQSGVVRPELGRKLSLEDRTNNFNNSPTISRSSSSVTPPKKEPDPRVIRKDSLKENIDKITQLQSQLMSAHLQDQEKHNSALKRDTSFRAASVEPAQRASIDAEPKSPSESISTPPPKSTPNSPPPASPKLNSPIHFTPSDNTDRSPPKSPSFEQPQSSRQTETVVTVPTSEVGSQTDESALSAENITENRFNLSDSGNGFGVQDLLDDTAEDALSSPKSASSLDLDCSKLSEELVRQLSPSDRLHHILVPKSFRSSSYYITGLYNPYIAPRAIKKDVGTSTPSESPVHSHSTTPIISSSDTPPPSPVASSHPLADSPLFNREITTLTTVDNLTRTKEELVIRLTSKIGALTREQSAIADETNANDRLGVDVGRRVTEQIRPVDASKFRSYVDDVGHITMLLLSLSGRLARTENELQIVEVGDSDRKTLEAKRDRLVEQLEEAKRLKEDIDRRGSVVCRILEQHLTIDGYADYDYFINMKAKLIVDAREIMDEIKMGEDQLNALKETLVHSEC